MPLIKSSKANEIVHDAVVLDLGDLNRQAEQIIADAQAAANDVIHVARAEAQQLTSSAAEDGHAQGYAEGLEQGLSEGRAKGHAEALEATRESLSEITDSWSQALQSFNEERQRMYLEARDDVLALALAVAQRVVHRAVALDPAVVRQQVAEALSVIAARTSVVIEVNPADRSIIEEALSDIVSQVDAVTDATITDDPKIAPGGCVVRTAGGRIDATIETQLARIVETLLPDAASRMASQSTDDEAAETPDEGDQ